MYTSVSSANNLKESLSEQFEMSFIGPFIQITNNNGPKALPPSLLRLLRKLSGLSKQDPATA